MKVGELVTSLKKYDSNLEILCYSEDEDLVPKGKGFLLLDISATHIIEGEGFRLDKKAHLKLEKTLNSQEYVVLDVTSDF